MAEEKKVKTTKTAAPKKAATKAPKVEKGENFAVIETGGKQYGVTTGDVITIEKILGEHKVGDSVFFDKVLLTDSGSVTLGSPYLASAKVSGVITEIGRSKKVIVIKYKQKSRYFKKNGHRQPFFKVQINSIA